MTSYLLTATGVIFLSVIVSILIPEGKLNKTITFVIRMICIFVLIQPVMNILNTDSADTASDDLADYAYVCSVYSDWQGEQLENTIKEKFGEEPDCIVEVIYSDGQFKINSVTVIFDEKSAYLIDGLYEYLESLGYINISVYASGT